MFAFDENPKKEIFDTNHMLLNLFEQFSVVVFVYFEFSM